jgi:hypothetical protein
MDSSESVEFVYPDLKTRQARYLMVVHAASAASIFAGWREQRNRLTGGACKAANSSFVVPSEKPPWPYQ